jgi:hypothetical protein
MPCDGDNRRNTFIFEGLNAAATEISALVAAVEGHKG